MSVLKNAADVLRLFASGQTELTVSDVTTQLSIPKANASRLLKSMRDAGMLETIGATRRHRPGSLVLDVASAFKHTSGLIRRATDVVAEVSALYGHTGYVSLREGREVTGVADFPGTNTLRVMGAVGRRLKAEQSATGRSLLARLRDAEVAELYHGYEGLDDLLKRLAVVRQQGFSFSSQEATPGVDAIAIAVANPAADEVVSLCIVYPHAVVADHDRNVMLSALAKGAAQIAEELGDGAFVDPTAQQKGNFA